MNRQQINHGLKLCFICVILFSLFILFCTWFSGYNWNTLEDGVIMLSLGAIYLSVILIVIITLGEVRYEEDNHESQSMRDPVKEVIRLAVRNYRLQPKATGINSLVLFPLFLYFGLFIWGICFSIVDRGFGYTVDTKDNILFIIDWLGYFLLLVGYVILELYVALGAKKPLRPHLRIFFFAHLFYLLFGFAVLSRSFY